MSPKISVSIVIPTLNEEKYIPLLLSSLVGTDVSLDIIIVDGYSEDKTIEVAKKFITRFSNNSSLRFLASDKRNISFQRNLGATIRKHETLMFLDADVIMPKVEDLKQMILQFTTSGAVVATPVLMSAERQFSTKFGFFVLVSFQRFMHLFNKPYFGGSCLLTTVEVFEKIGGFDENVELAEDVDYSFRATEFGRSKILSTTILVSGRRFLKYGVFSVLFQLMKATLILMSKGRVTSQNTYYPFGDYE